jgi:hypothetical protein
VIARLGQLADVNDERASALALLVPREVGHDSPDPA